ncbi:MAG TPA: hypothetical protein VGD80_14225 [Kofleriaceae bacterium]
MPGAERVDRQREIAAPWTVYAATFSPDGRRLAIGGGSWYGGGGIIIVELATGRSQQLRCADLPDARALGATVSGLCFSADARHLVASTWSDRHADGAVMLFEVDGLALHHHGTFRCHGPGDARRLATTGVVLHGGAAIARNHGSLATDMIAAVALPPVVDRTPVRQLGSQRIVVAGDRAITGNQGETAMTIDPDGSAIWRRARTGSLLVAPLARPGAPERIEVGAGSWVTAIARLDDAVVTGTSDGDLDAWSLDGSWRRRRLRAATPRAPIVHRDDASWVNDDETWLSYAPNSIVDVCRIPARCAAGVSAGGELCLFDAAGVLESHALAPPGSPRAIAAHPDGAALAIGLKAGGGASAVVVVDLRTDVDPALCSPTARSLARAASAGDRHAFTVLADALEEAGAPAFMVSHLYEHDPALPSCWVVDAILGAE